MYELYLGNFNKKVNSTARPNYSTWAKYDVYLKHECNYDRPVVILNAEFASVAPQNYNYAILFGRWYWVTDIIAVRTGVIEIHLSLDILAAFQGAIKSTKAFIEYGANTFDAGDSSTKIADARRPVKRVPTVYVRSASLTGGSLSATGSFIMQVVTEQGVRCYAVTYTQLQAIMLNVYSAVSADVAGATSTLDPTDPDTASYSIAKLLELDFSNSLVAESAMSAIKSIHWLPISWGSISGTSEQIVLGNYPTGQYGTRLLNNQLWSHSDSISIPWPVNDWRRNNTQISLYLPFFGTIPVPVDQCINNASVSFTLSLDVLSGDCSIRVTSSNQTIYTGSTNIAAPYAFGMSAVSTRQSLQGGIQAATGAIQAATGVIDAGAGIIGSVLGLGGNISSGIQSIASGAQNVISGYAQTIQPLITSAGSMGGIAALGQDQNVIISLIYYAPIADSDFESLYGHPVFKVDYPVNGFCKTRGFSLSQGTEAANIAYVNAAMDGGVFIED